MELHAIERDGLTRVRATVNARCPTGCVGRKRRRFKDALLDRIAIIQEGCDRQPSSDFGRAAEVIAVKVRDQQVVQLGDASVFRGGQDTIGVAISEPFVTRVDEH
jgi:hypothetical protein